MKLFGSYSHNKDNKNNEIESNQNPEKGNNGTSILNSFFHSKLFRKFKVPLIILCCLVLFILIVLLIYSIWEKPPEVVSSGPIAKEAIRSSIQEPQEPIKDIDSVSETIEPIILTPEPTSNIDEAPKTGRRENCYTFTILAYDQMEANTDTVIVGNLDLDNESLKLVSIPRDTLVNVSWGVKKLNSILANERNDPERFLEHLGNLIGFTVDCYAIVDIKAAEKLVDCIGGVYYNVPRDMDYDDPSQNLSIHIPKGYQHLNGEDSVKVLRFRVGNDNTGYPNGDLGRIKTQQDFLKTLASQLISLGNIPNIDNAIEIFETYVDTNLSASNLAFLLRSFLLIDNDSISFSTMPGDGISIRGGSYYQANIDEWVSIVNDYLNPFYQVITADNLNILQENGSDGAISTTGEIVPLNSFYDFSKYLG